jgi:hypothetical protein
MMPHQPCKYSNPRDMLCCHLIVAAAVATAANSARTLTSGVAGEAISGHGTSQLWALFLLVECEG